MCSTEAAADPDCATNIFPCNTAADLLHMLSRQNSFVFDPAARDDLYASPPVVCALRFKAAAAANASLPADAGCCCRGLAASDAACCFFRALASCRTQFWQALRWLRWCPRWCLINRESLKHTCNGSVSLDAAGTCRLSRQ